MEFFRVSLTEFRLDFYGRRDTMNAADKMGDENPVTPRRFVRNNRGFRRGKQ